jgi:HAD superfamily hydrolase (TIGR01490 family)
VDGTLAGTTIVSPLIWYRKRLPGGPRSWLWLASLCVRAPYWLIVDRCSRAASNRAIYSNYGGMNCARVRELASACYADCIKPRLYPQAMKKLTELRQEGVRIVLVSGGLDFLMQPLAAELGADLIVASLEERGGSFTGALRGEPLTGALKAERLRAHAAEHGVDLAQSCAFGDAFGDLPLLESVGHPVAVNADGRLAAIAKTRGWQTETWRLPV